LVNEYIYYLDTQAEKISSPFEVRSPKNKTKLINLHFDPTPCTSTGSNENFVQDHIITTFDSLEDELQHLQELEKLLKNTKLLVQKTSENVDYVDHEILPSSSLKFLKDVKRSDSLEQNKLGPELIFSDEENDGYKSGTSCFSDKQFEKKTLPFSPKNSNIISSMNPAKKFNPGMVTIDLVKEKSKDNKRNKVDIVDYLHKLKNK
jgi:hypothetical protein